MNTISIIILTVTFLAVAVSFGVLFFSLRRTSKAPNIVKVRSCDPSVQKILNARSGNDGNRLTQKELLENADYVLNAFH